MARQDLNQENPIVILKRREVEALVRLSRSTIYLRLANGCFPKPVNLGSKRAVGWVKADIDRWLQDAVDKSHEQEQPRLKGL